MPRSKQTSLGATERFNVRLDPDSAAFYRAKANEHGISMSEFFRQILVQGIIADTVHEIELRLRAAVADIRDGDVALRTPLIPDDVLLSLFSIEAMLVTIVTARDIQGLYAAQDKAAEKLRLRKEANG